MSHLLGVLARVAVFVVDRGYERAEHIEAVEVNVVTLRPRARFDRALPISWPRTAGCRRW